MPFSSRQKKFAWEIKLLLSFFLFLFLFFCERFCRWEIFTIFIAFDAQSIAMWLLFLFAISIRVFDLIDNSTWHCDDWTGWLFYWSLLQGGISDYRHREKQDDLSTLSRQKPHGSGVICNILSKKISNKVNRCTNSRQELFL